MTEALMKLVKATATRTVDIILTSFISASAIFFCYLFLLLCCALSWRRAAQWPPRGVRAATATFFTIWQEINKAGKS